MEPKDQKPYFVNELQSTEVVSGYSATLHAKVISHPPARVAWSFNNKEIHDDAHYQVSETSPGHLTLLIRDASTEGYNVYLKIYR